MAARVATVALVVLVTRALAYALVPDPRADVLASRTGGATVPAVAIGALALALAIGSATVFLAALAVRERLRVERRPLAVAPVLRVRHVLLRASALFAVALPASAALEAFVHWRSGLGWHGLSCLSGPVHHDLVPLVGAVSIVAAALSAAVGHVLAWMRRVVAALASAPRLAPRRPALQMTPAQLVPRAVAARSRSARGPPLLGS